MHREAEMIEQQLKAKQAAAGGAQTQPQAAAPAAAQTTAGGQTQDYSAQWAEYYRSIGKIEEAEAIEKQMKVSLIYITYTEIKKKKTTLNNDMQSS